MWSCMYVSCPATSSKRSSCPAWAALSWFRVGGYCWWSRNLQLTSSGWEKFPVFTIVWDTFQEIPGGCFLVWDFWTINSMTVRRFSNDLTMHTCDVVLFPLKSWKANKIRRCVSKCPCLYQCYFRHGKLFHNLPTSQLGITNLNQVTWSISPWVPPSPLFPSKRRWSLVT